MRTTAVLFEQPPLLSPLLTTREAAELLGVGRQTVVRWVDEGHAQPTKRMAGPNGSYVFTADEIERLRATPRPRKPRHAA